MAVSRIITLAIHSDQQGAVTHIFVHLAIDLVRISLYSPDLTPQALMAAHNLPQYDAVYERLRKEYLEVRDRLRGSTAEFSPNSCVSILVGLISSHGKAKRYMRR